MKKRSLKEARKIFVLGGVEPIFEKYVSANEPLEFKCICGEIDKISISSLKRTLSKLGNIRCKKCRHKELSKNKNLVTKEKILSKFKGINIIKIFPGEHNKSYPKIIFNCPMCGKEDKILYKKDLEFLLCKKCSHELISEKQRLSQDYVKSLFKNEGAILLSEYKHTHQKLVFQCKCGEIGTIMLTNLKYKNIAILCKQCQLKFSYPRGKDNFNWNPNLLEEDRLSWGRNNEDKQWYRRVFERFKYSCFISGERNIALSAHHLFQYSRYPKLRLDLDNGICISREFHLEFHKKFSYKNTSIEDFCIYFFDKTGIDFREYYDIENKRWREDTMKTFSLSEAVELVRKCGAEPLFNEYINSYSDYLLRCSCGNEEKIKFSTLGRNLKKNSNYRYKCSKCRNLGRPTHTTESLREDFIKYGAEPLFNKYKSLREKLKYRCECGIISFITCEQFYSRVKKYENYKLRCHSCACKESLKDKTNNFFNDIIKPYFEERKIRLISKSYENNHTYLKFICSCGKEGEVTWGSVRNNNCLKCKECQLKDRPRGENHPDWNSSLTEEDRRKTRYGRGNLEKIWESCILRLSDFKCIISDTKGGKLSAHHLNAWARNPEERFRFNNGVCISKEYHKLFHDKYGMKKGNNTLKQFKEFYKNETNKEFKENNIVIDFVEETPYPSFLLNRKKNFLKEGREYIPFFSPEIRLKQDIVLSMIRYKWNKINKRFFARRLEVKEIHDFSKVKNFLDENHIQGYTVSSVNLALMDNGEILSLMTFIKNKNEGEYLLQRFCSRINTVVVGGASKLFKFFTDKYSPDKIITYGDVRFSELDGKNSIYSKLGFKYSHTSKPNYWYTKDGIHMYFRRNFQKKYLDKFFNKEFDSSLSEREIMLSEGYQRLYDCGNHVFVYEK